MMTLTKRSIDYCKQNRPERAVGMHRAVRIDPRMYGLETTEELQDIIFKAYNDAQANDESYEKMYNYINQNYYAKARQPKDSGKSFNFYVSWLIYQDLYYRGLIPGLPEFQESVRKT